MILVISILLLKNLISLATKADIDDLVGKTDVDDKLKNLNKNATSNKAKHVEAEKKLTDLTNKVA